MNISGCFQFVINLLLLQSVAHSVKYASFDTNQQLSTEYVYKCNVIASVIDCNSNVSVVDLQLEINRIVQQNPNRNYYVTIIIDALFTEINENVFRGISFDKILLLSAPTLTRIHKNAFQSTAKTVDKFYLGSPTKLKNSPPVYDLYYALSALTNASDITISLDPSVNHTIPDNAFSNVNGIQKNLTSIKFHGHFNITRIGDNVFYEIPFESNSSVEFVNNRIETISTKAFDLKTWSDSTLQIRLSWCDLSHHSFANNAFNGSRRPLYLYLAYNRIEYIEEKTFSSFFAANQRNAMNLIANPLNCSNITRFQWLLDRKQQLEERVLYARCGYGRHNGESIWHLNTNGVNSNTTSNHIILTFVSISSAYLFFTRNLFK